MMHSGTPAVKLNLFWKTVSEAICSKTESPLSPERCMTDHTGISMPGLSGTEARPEVLLDNQDIYSVNQLVENQVV